MVRDEPLSDFNEVRHNQLRDYNRGQVMSNIFEQNAIEGAIPAKRFRFYLEEISSYLSRIPPDEVGAAKTANREELAHRGYSFG